MSALALLACALALAAPAEGSFPGANGKLAFTSDPSGFDLEVYAMNPDGSGQIDLTNNPASDSGPTWSPDGRKIAFSTDRDVNDEIYIMNADGTNPVDLTNDAASDTSPAWSGGAQKLAFTRDDGSFDLEIWAMNADGSGQTNLTNNPALDTGAAWSPNGQKIAFTTTRDGNSEIYVMNADGSGQMNLTNNSATDSGPDWSPDGSKIAFASRRDGNAEIYVMSADGSNPTRLTTNTTSDFSPAWSPDATKIAFRSNRDGNGYEIYVMNAGGSGQTRLTTNSYLDIDPDWQPLPYEHPQSALQLKVSLVPLFKQCGTGGNPTNAKHAPPLAVGSCNTPATTGTAHLGVNAVASAQLTVMPGDPSTTADEADVVLAANATDVRTGSATGPDYDPNPSGADVTLSTRLRVTDYSNGTSQSAPATATDLDFATPVTCAATADTTIGATCAANTTADAVMPGAIKEGKQAILQVFRVRVNDSGGDGIRGNSDDKLFAQQGFFVP